MTRFKTQEELKYHLDGLTQGERNEFIIRTYLDARTDNLTGFPNERSLREDLGYMRSQDGYCLYFGDILSLKSANDNYGYDVGNALIIYSLLILRKSLSDFSKDFEVYREHGDEIVGITRDVDEGTSDIILERIRRYCEISNLVRSLELNGTNLITEEEKKMIDWVNETMGNLRIYRREITLPDELPVMISIGYGSSGDPYEALDHARKMSKEDKRSFYERHPELDSRGRKV